MREKYEEFMQSVLESKKEYEDLLVEVEQLNEAVAEGRKEN